MIIRRLCAGSLAVALSSSVALADGRRAMVVAADGSTSPAAVQAAVRGGKRTTPALTVGAGSLADSALIVGCDAATTDCRLAVAEQLEIDELIVVASSPDGEVTITAYHQGAAPVTRTARMSGPDDRTGQAAVEDAAGQLLGGPAAVSGSGGDGAGTGDRVGDAGSPPAPGVPRGAAIVGIGGGVLLVSGLVLWGLAASAQSDIDAAPTATPADLDRLAALEDDGRTYAAAGNGLVITGAVAVVAAAGWILWHRKHAHAQPRLTPAIGPGVATLALEGSW